MHSPNRDASGKLVLRLTDGILLLLHGIFKPQGKRTRVTPAQSCPPRLMVGNRFKHAYGAVP